MVWMVATKPRGYKPRILSVAHICKGFLYSLNPFLAAIGELNQNEWTDAKSKPVILCLNFLAFLVSEVEQANIIVQIVVLLNSARNSLVDGNSCCNQSSTDDLIILNSFYMIALANGSGGDSEDMLGLDIGNVFVSCIAVFVFFINQHKNVDIAVMTGQNLSHQVLAFALTQNHIGLLIDFIPVNKEHMTSGVWLCDKSIHITIRDA